MADENIIKPVLPKEIQKFNWGAFFLTWIWGLGNRSYITLFAFLVYGVALVFRVFGVFIPLSLAFAIYCGVMGNEWAFKNKTWESVEHFNRVQKRWSVAGVIFFITTRLLTILLVFLALLLGFYLLVPKGDIKKPEDISSAVEKAAAKFVEYAVETSLDGTDMSSIKNSNELAREVASGFGSVSVGNAIPIGKSGKTLLRAYKYGEDCTLNKKNCHVEVKYNDIVVMKYYIDENKKLVPVPAEVLKRESGLK